MTTLLAPINDMKPKGIIMGDFSVRALLEDRKSMTRRVIKPQPPRGKTIADYCTFAPQYGFSFYSRRGDGCWESEGRFPYPLLVGTELWVRETWAVSESFDDWAPRDLPHNIFIHYLADGPKPEGFGKTRSPLFMPHEFSRIRRVVTSVRVERVSEISEEDAIAEGCARGWYTRETPDGEEIVRTTYQAGFRALWNSLHSTPKPVKVDGKTVAFESYPFAEGLETREHRGLPWHVYGSPWVFVYGLGKVEG